MKIPTVIAALILSPTLMAVEWSIELCSSLDLLAGRTGIADVRPSNDPHHNSDQMMEQNSGIYRGQWSWQSEMPELLYGIMHSGEAAKASPSGFTALHAACVYADENLFHALLEAGVPIDTRPGDWQQLGYVGDTPLGLLVRFMNARTASTRVRMARMLLEKGADPDAPMTTWSGNRVVTTVPFCELGNQDYNHDMRMLLLQFGEQNLQKRTSGWNLNLAWYREDLIQRLKEGGMAQKPGPVVTAGKQTTQLAGTVPLLDLVRKGDVEGVRLALEAGASIEVSPRAKRYGQEPMFNIPVRRKDSPEAAVEIARMLIEAGSDINALNRHGNSLRIHYDRYYSKASMALCYYLKKCGALIHPDSPMKKAEVQAEEQARQQRIQARYRRLNGIQEARPETVPTEAPAEVTAPVAEPAAPTEAPAEVTAPETEPAAPTEAPAEVTAPETESAAPTEAPAEVTAPETEPAAPTEAPAEVTAPETESAAPTEAPAEVTAPAAEPAAPTEAPADKLRNAHLQQLLPEVQAQLAELQLRYEAELKAKEEKKDN